MRGETSTSFFPDILVSDSCIFTKPGRTYLFWEKIHEPLTLKKKIKSSVLRPSYTSQPTLNIIYQNPWVAENQCSGMKLTV
jgi:hypothetical protein